MGCEKKGRTGTLGAGSIFEVSYDCGESFEIVPGMTAIGAIGGQSETVETTAIDDTARTYIGALETPAAKNFTGNYRPENAAQVRFYQAGRNREIVHVRVTFPTKPRTVSEQEVALLGFQVNEPTAEGVLTFTVNGQATGQADWFSIPYVPVESITITPETITGEVGGTATIAPTIMPPNASDKRCRYISVNPMIASVERDSGVVKFKEVGETEIHVVTEDGDFSAIVKVTVTAATTPPEGGDEGQ